MKETELAKAVVELLSVDGWDIYQEVECGGGVADIVAVQNRRVWIVECKKSLGLSVLDQAVYRLRCAHWVSVAVPRSRHRTRLVQQILRWKGIGLIHVGDYGAGIDRDARLNRAGHKGAIELIDRLEPEHKTAAEAGIAGGGRWTPFRRTCRDALSEVRRLGPMPIAELMKNVNHHYASNSSARANFVVWIREGKVPGLKIDEGTRPLQVSLTE